jgi:hypothetical protein
MRVKRRAAQRVHTCRGPRIVAGLLSEQRIPTGVPTPQAWGQWAALGAEDPVTGFPAAPLEREGQLFVRL